MRHRSVGRFSNEPLWELVDPQFTIPIDQSNVVISDTHTFNPTTINEFRFGFNRRHRTRRPATQDGNWAQQLGIPNVSPETFPEILGAGTRYYNFGPGGMDEQLAQDYTFQNNVTKIVGKHTLKFGYELVRTTYDSLVEALPSGIYNMAGSERPFTPNTGQPICQLPAGNGRQRPVYANDGRVAAALVVAFLVRANRLEADSDTDTQSRPPLVLRDPVPNCGWPAVPV